jgi:predicted Rossmann fold nucleotide-binding protein DprA/Smf involved in DNA uptake
MEQQIFYMGDQSILDLYKVAFLSSRRISSDAVLKCLDWATEQRDKGVCVMSGFHSPLEKDVLYFLLKGKQPVVLVLGRSLYRQFPNEFEKPLEEKRLLIVSPMNQTISRYSARSSLIRNKYIIDTADEIVFGALDMTGSLYPLYEKILSEGKLVKKIIRENNSSSSQTTAVTLE